MTALYMDSFDQYGTGTAAVANMLDGVWAAIDNSRFSVGTPSWGASRTGQNCFIMSVVGQPTESRFVVPGNPKTVFMSFGFALDFLPPATAGALFDVRNTSNTILYSVTVNPTGGLELRSGGPGGQGTVITTTSGPVIRAQTWHFIEAEINFTAGTLIVRVDDSDATGTPALTGTISTSGSNGLIGIATCASGGNGLNYYYDDLFVRDDNGTVNNSWLGDRRIALLMADADTPTSGWTPSYYQKFGSGVLRLANLVPNNNTPVNPNSLVIANGNTIYDLGSADWTQETFIRFEAIPIGNNYSTIFSRWDALGNSRSYRLVLGGNSFNNSCLQFDYTTDGTSGTLTTPIVYPFAPNLNQWYHIALVRASNELLLFVDGEQIGLPIPITATLFPAGTTSFNVGAESGSNGVVLNSYVTGLYDETRITNGFARYTAPFAVPNTAFPRGAGSDPQWSDVVFLAGYDNGIQDESSFAKQLFPQNGAASFTVNDGPMVGVFSTVNKVVPDDNTFISASLVNATGILTMTTQPTNGNTVTVGTKDGTNPAVYTFKNTLSAAYDILIDTTAENTLLNLSNAINALSGAGVKYGTGTLANVDVSSTQLPAGQIEAVALIAGTGGNSIASTSTGTAATWNGTTLSGGASIPGPTNFKVQRPPPNTTIVSAVQLTVRGYKSDSGTCVIQNGLVGPLGGITHGSTHNLATNPGYYLDIIEADPDTSNPISPSTIVNGQLQINRTT